MADFRKSTLREYFESIVIAVILALFIRTFVVQAFKIPTGSMEENLLIGDHLLVNKFVLGPTATSIERTVLPSTEFPHLLLDLHPLYRTKPWENWRTIKGAVGAWRSLGALARREQPRLIVGTGGYAAGLALAYAVAHHIPIVQQAGDSYPGLTARAFRRWTREYYLAFPEAGRVIGGAPSQHLDTGAPIGERRREGSTAGSPGTESANEWRRWPDEWQSLWSGHSRGRAEG